MVMPTPDESPSADSATGGSKPARSLSKQKRVLACVLCQQRKIKCDRKFPCKNCVRSGVQCVPAALVPRQRRRRFAERELLERIRHYEGLLGQNDITFDPLHSSTANSKLINVDEKWDASSAAAATRQDAHQGSRQQSTSAQSDTSQEAKSFWTAMKLEPMSPWDDDENVSEYGSDEVDEDVVKDAVDRYYQTKESLLFGLRKTDADISTLHPDQVQIFRLWQIYLDNVNPLLKVIHTPTMQSRIIEAATNLSGIDRSLEALLFGIYSTAILSLQDDECIATFGVPKKELETSYQLGCQQALMNNEFLTCRDRDGLTAVFLYLLSIRSDTHPQSMSAMLGVVMRIAQRMGINSEAALAKSDPLEAEMRRRLWWALVGFDARISEQSEWTTTPLTPIWDCNVPLNVNDFDLLPNMTSPPAAHKNSTEALFAVVRGEMAEFTRHSAFFLDFVNPTLKGIAKDVSKGRAADSDTVIVLEEAIEQGYLQYCTPENPLHFITIWMARGYFAKARLMEHLSRHKTSISRQTDAQRNAGLTHALRMLECDTMLLSSLKTKGYHWFIEFQFPFPAYMQIMAEVRRRPFGEHADKSWALMNENYEARFLRHGDGLQVNPIFKVFGRMVLRAWAPRAAGLSSAGGSDDMLRLISDIKALGVQEREAEVARGAEQRRHETSTNRDELPGNLPYAPMEVSSNEAFFGIGGQGSGVQTGEEVPMISDQDLMNMNMDQFDWPPINWSHPQW